MNFQEDIDNMNDILEYVKYDAPKHPIDEVYVLRLLAKTLLNIIKYLMQKST